MISKKFVETKIPEKVLEKIQNIKNDKKSGSIELTKKTLDALVFLIKNTNFSDETDLKKKIVSTCYRIHKAQPSMASIFNLVNNIVFFLEKTDNYVEKRVLAFLEKTRQDLDEITKKICKNAYNILKENKKILTHSYSITVLESLVYAKKHNSELKVYCTESRPMFEGRIIARRLAEENIKVKIIVDTAVDRIINDVDVVFVGGDSISKRGVLNKIGTKNLAISAEMENINLFCLCGSNKIIPKNYVLPNEVCKKPDEVWDIQMKNITPVNYYFEYTPLKFFSYFVNEKGLSKYQKIKNRIEKKKVHNIFI